jgi:hypothetical protein
MLSNEISSFRPTVTLNKLTLKLKLSHYTPRRRLGGEEVYLLLILDLGTRWGWVVSVTPRSRFSPGERTPGTHCTGGWVGPRAGLDTETRGKILSSLPGIEPRSPGRPARSQTLYWLSYPAHTNLYCYHELNQPTTNTVASVWIVFHHPTELV